MISTRCKLALACALWAAVATSAAAFELYGERWRDGRATIYGNIEQSTGSGKPWNAALVQAADAWNDVVPGFRLDVNGRFSDPCAGITEPEDNFFNGVGFKSTDCGIPFNDGTLAINVSYIDEPGGFIVESDTVFNSNVDWDIYSGPLRRDTLDFRRVAAHELGHFSGLDHEDDRLALMNSFVGDVEVPQADDIAGMRSLYPSPDNALVFEHVLEEPLIGEVHSGVGNLRGWAVASDGIDRVEMWLNGRFLFEMPTGGDRADVAAAFPDIVGAQQSGYSMAFAYSNLGAGTHTMTARAYTTQGAMAASSSTFSVVTLDKNFIPASDEVATGAATCELGGDEIELFDVFIDDRVYDLLLKWRTAEQGFEIIEIR